MQEVHNPAPDFTVLGTQVTMNVVSLPPSQNIYRYLDMPLMIRKMKVLSKSLITLTTESKIDIPYAIKLYLLKIYSR